MVAHDVLTYLSAKDVNFPDIDVKITDYSYEEVDTLRYNPEYKIEYREGKKPTVSSDNPLFDENIFYNDFIKYSKPVDGKVSSLEVLAMYSVEPDWGMDTGLYLSPIQKLMGGSNGYRHMRYVLFYLIRAGVLKKQIRYFDSLSKIAFGKNDIYWGIRFSARTIHYLEDFLTPVHAKPCTESFIVKNILFPKKIFNIAFNYHINFEKLTGYHIWHSNPELIGAIENSKIREYRSLAGILSNTHLKTRLMFYPIFKELDRLWRKKMEAKPVIIETEEIQNNPEYSRVLKYSANWLEYSSSIVKGYIKNFLIPRLTESINGSKSI